MNNKNTRTAFYYLSRAVLTTKKDVLIWLHVFLQYPHAATLSVLRKWGKANLPDRKYVALMRYINLFLALHKVLLENPHYVQKRPYYDAIRHATIDDILNIVQELNYEQ